MTYYTALATSLVTEQQQHEMTSAVSIQGTHHFCPHWGLPATALHVLPQGVKPTPGDVVIALLDQDASVPDSLGFHSEDTDGVKFGSILCEPCLQDLDPNPLVSVSSCLSHEFMEILADLACNIWAQDSGGIFWAHEVADPVESNMYPIHNVQVSDFVLPPWFDDDPLAGSQFNYMATLNHQFSIDKGGYAVIWDPGNTSPRQVFGKQKADHDTSERTAFRASYKSRNLSRTGLRLSQ